MSTQELPPLTSPLTRFTGTIAYPVRFCSRAMTAPWCAVHEMLKHNEGNSMHRIIYIIGLIVVILAILSFFGLR